MTRVFPLPAPARMSTGPSVVSTASRCCGFSWSRNDKTELAPGVDLSILQDNLDTIGCPTQARFWLERGFQHNVQTMWGQPPSAVRRANLDAEISHASRTPSHVLSTESTWA